MESYKFKKIFTKRTMNTTVNVPIELAFGTRLRGKDVVREAKTIEGR